MPERVPRSTNRVAHHFAICSGRRGISMRLVWIVLFAAGFAASSPATYATDAAPVRETCDEPIVQGYEPTTLGYTWQRDDEPFVDFTLSFKAPLFRDLLCKHFDGH